MNKYDSRKQFIKSQGATCDNWTWSWSFVNHDKKILYSVPGIFMIKGSRVKKFSQKSGF